MVQRLLIANRGEPVMRAVRTARRLGIEIAVVCAHEDRMQDWVRAVDYVLPLERRSGPGADNPYLDGAQIIALAQQYGCDAIWPAWGFLAEDPHFAQAVTDAGLSWVGPSAAVMRQLGSKESSSRVAAAAKVPTVPEVVLPGRDVTPESIVDIHAQHPELTFPLLLKPAWGGGGQGQQIVQSAQDLVTAYEVVLRINAAQFQSGPILLQRYLQAARHIEMQVIADDTGNCIVFAERDCSMQRRNQKILEESPSVAITDDQRAWLSDAAQRLVGQVGYTSAGTLEFLAAQDAFFFLEMNTRLQVEHPVTEEVSRWRDAEGVCHRIDLLEWMLNIADGQSLPTTPQQIVTQGHAVEVRLYAEDALRNFQPTPGAITYCQFPYAHDVRVDVALQGPQGEIDARYDPMIGKIIAWDETRAGALAQMDRALQDTTIAGIQTNVSFLRGLVATPELQSGNYHTQSVPALADRMRAHTAPRDVAVLGAALAAYERERQVALKTMMSGQVTDVQGVLAAIPSNAHSFCLRTGDALLVVDVSEWQADAYVVRYDDQCVTCAMLAAPSGAMNMRMGDGRVHSVVAQWRQDDVTICVEGHRFDFHLQDDATTSHRDPHLTPGGGKIVAIMVAPGDVVEIGRPLYTLEAMKMESQVLAACAGRVDLIHVEAGEAVEADQRIVTIEPTEGDASTQSTPESAASTMQLPHDHSSTASFFANPIAWCDGNHTLDLEQITIAMDCMHSYLRGYDIPEDVAVAAGQVVVRGLESGQLKKSDVAIWVGGAIDCYRKIQELLSEDHAHGVIYFTEHLFARERRIPRATEQLLKDVGAEYGYDRLGTDAPFARCLLHALQGAYNNRRVRNTFLYELTQVMALTHGCHHVRLSSALGQLLESPLLKQSTRQYNAWRQLIEQVDPAAVYLIEEPPVAPEYWESYEELRADPLAGLSPDACTRMRTAVAQLMQEDGAVDCCALEGEVGAYCAVLFPEGEFVSLPMPACALRDVTLNLYAVRASGSDDPWRLVTIASFHAATPHTADGVIESFPHVEAAAVACYSVIHAYCRLESEFCRNHIILQFPESQPFIWQHTAKTGGSHIVTPDIIRQISRRIAGFARGTHIAATDVLVSLQGGSERQVIEVWHAPRVGLLNRPPVSVTERAPEWGGQAASDLRQRRLGKLLNRDRAQLLFDEGQWTELAFPEADVPDGDPIGLNVYRGQIQGQDALAYAGDFRHRGGALGEREGKKLAAAVVLAYALQIPLVAIHDGAGANIKGSVASLGWAGAYFGAIAATGGHGTATNFSRWYKSHINRPYFDAVLKNFSVQLPGHGDALPLIHLHLHLGAAVGMLVYGPAISSCSLMVDHPEVYRLLTGAATVERVLGERGTNYDLGGAPIHGQLSGEVDFVLADEPAVLATTRRLVALFSQRTRIPAGSSSITRPADLPQPTLPRSGGIIVGRDAIVANVDEGVFWEIRRDLSRSGGLLTGYAALAGQPVMLGVTATDYGIHHGRTFKKMQLAATAAQDFGLPLIAVVGANWDRLQPVVRTETLYQQHEMRRAMRLARMPKIGVILGPRALEQEIHEMLDLRCYVVRGSESEYELQRAAMLCHCIVHDLAAAFDWCADLLRYLPRQWELDRMEREGRFGGRRIGASGVAQTPVVSYEELLPATLTEAYEMRTVVGAVVDAESFREFAPDDQQPLIVGVATIDGRVVGVIADAPNIEGGAQTVISISKFTRFHRFCERFGLPIIELNDSPAFRPGRRQEQAGIQGEGGKSIREEVLSPIPKIAVTLRQNYGGRYIHANLNTLGPPRVGVIVAGARIGVMGAEGAVGVLMAKKLAAIADPAERERVQEEAKAEYIATRLNPKQAIELGYAQAMVPLRALRSTLIEILGSV